MVLFKLVEKWSSKDLQRVLNLVLGVLEPNLGVKGIWVPSSLLLPLLQKGKPRQALGNTDPRSMEIFMPCRSLQGCQNFEMRAEIWVASKVLFLERRFDSSGRQRLTEFWTMRAGPLSCYQWDFRMVLAKGANIKGGGEVLSSTTTSAKIMSCYYSSRRCPAGNIWEDSDTQWKPLEGVPRLEVTYVALKVMYDKVAFLSALDRWVIDFTSDSPGELTKCQGSVPSLVQLSVTSGPCTNSYESLGPSFPFSLFKS